MDQHEPDPYIGIQPTEGYYLTEKINQGKVGTVYKAARKSPSPGLDDVLACKVIPLSKLRDGWELEVEKLLRLKRVPYIVPYRGHKTLFDNNNNAVCCILSEYIPSQNLRDYLSSTSVSLDMAFIENVAQNLFTVLYACRKAGIQHGDLHDGNILISEPEALQIGAPRGIWIADFGCGGSHNDLEPRDDFRQFFSIVSTLLRRISPSDATPRDRVMLQKMMDFISRRTLESDPTQKHWVGDIDSLLAELRSLGPAAEREAAAASRGEHTQETGDYLVAEALGYRKDEWKNLFVPHFLAASDLLSRNVTILTGARGCGKTMTFRRLTLFMDKVVGQPSGVEDADTFIGFYLNCRDLVEVFPWLPRKLNIGAEQQIIHYFHLAWLSEICRTLAICDPEGNESYAWLESLLVGIFDAKYQSLPRGANVLAHVQSFLSDEKERCRLASLGKEEGIIAWPLARTEFLDSIDNLLRTNVALIGEKPIYFFLDDYTIPIVTRQVQRVLNQIIFRRRATYFFKISTEAANSFLRESVRGKPLELHQDFKLIDLATESLHQSPQDRASLLDRIFRPRIDRHPLLKGKNLGLRDVLGRTPLSNNELARQMRDAVQKGANRQVLYHGQEAFVGMWASDIRMMIQMLVDMLREANGSLQNTDSPVIPPDIQDKCYRTAGGEFLGFSASVVDPAFWEKGPTTTKPGEAYGTQLRKIAEAFIRISRYELTHGDLVSNQGRFNPRQAFRLEIPDAFELPPEAQKYYEGLVRWHIFLQDWRGKSVRGMITPRLYLNRILIPFAKLTFSTHDNIPLTNNQFISLLTSPGKFPREYARARNESRKRSKRITAGSQMSL
jgi:serine/threonine protein kinase